MSRFRKMFKIAGVAGVVIVGGGTVALTQKMFVDRHAMVRKKSFKRFFYIDYKLNVYFMNYNYREQTCMLLGNLIILTRKNNYYLY